MIDVEREEVLKENGDLGKEGLEAGDNLYNNNYLLIGRVTVVFIS